MTKKQRTSVTLSMLKANLELAHNLENNQRILSGKPTICISDLLDILVKEYLANLGVTPPLPLPKNVEVSR